MKNLNIGYFADGPWSHEALEKLILDETIMIKFICARNDTPDEYLKIASRKYGIDFFTHPNVNSRDFLSSITYYNCDLFVSMSFNQIFRTEIINLPPLGSINCHAGKLPFYRGRNVLNWVLINDESDFGITVHYIDEGIDTGDIIQQRIYKIDDTDDYATLLAKAYKQCGPILYDSIKLVQAGNLRVIKQSELDLLGTYCTARILGDENLDWNQTSRNIFNFVRAICEPGPQARTRLNGNEIKINCVEYLPNATKYKGISGSVIGVDSDAFLVKTGDSFVRVTRWSGYEMPKIGDRFR
jgi:methionyl-tRNA formyltransferase